MGNASSKLEIALSIDGAIDGADCLDDCVEEVPSDTALTDSTAGSVMVYSSGTTGRPKGIRRPLPQRSVDDPAFVNSTTLVMRTFGFNSDDRYLCPAPLYHSAPIRSCSAMHQLGATVVVMHKFDAETVLKIVDEQKISVGQFVPTHFKRLLSLPNETRARYDCRSLRIAVHSAAPCPREIKQAMIDWWGPVLLEYYAGTEGGGVKIDSTDWLKKPGSVGKPWDGLSVAIQNDANEMVQTPGLEGPVYFRNEPGAVPNFSYYKDPLKTEETYCGDWFTLGDIGYLDEDGFLFLTDRKSNLIISGGVNIYPLETESLLSAHDKVYDVAVIGVPDEDLGEAVKAVVVVNHEHKAGPELAQELIDYTRSQLSTFKCPKTIDFVDALPRTETGKLLKRKLRAQYWPK